MKMCKKIPFLFLLMLMMIGSLSIHVHAETKTQDGLDVELTADQNQYDYDEEITATLTVENNGEAAVNIISMDIPVPEGYMAVAADDEISLCGELNPEEKLIKTVTFTPEEEMYEETHFEDAEMDFDDGSTSRKQRTPNTSDRNDVLFWFVIMYVSFSVVVLGTTIRLCKKYLSLLLCFGLAGSLIAGSVQTVNAEETETGRIVMNEEIMVGEEYKTITASVEYKTAAEEEPVEEPAEDSGEEQNEEPVEEPVNDPVEDPGEELTEREEYYHQNSEIIDTIIASESDDVLTESEAAELFMERGFADYPVTYDYSINGDFGEGETEEGSAEKHPVYQTSYISEAGEIWTLYIINDAVMAYPVSYKFDTQSRSDLLISETDTLISYDGESNKFFITKPFESVAKIKTVQEINAQTLDELTVEELKKL